MKVKSSKKTALAAIAALLSVSMVLGACSSNNGGSNTPAANGNGGNNQGASQSEGDGEATKEEVTLSIGGNQFALTFPSGVQTDPVAMEIKRKTGVTLDVDSKGDPDKFKVQLASGDLPDIIVAQKDKMQQLIEGNLVIPLDELIQTHGKTILEENPKMVEASKKFFSNNTDKLYFLLGLSGDPAISFKYESPGYLVRWDYYKELGYPAYSSFSDIIQILKQMQDKHPTNEQGQKVYGMAPLFEWGLTVLTEFFNRYEGKVTMPGFMDVDTATLEANSTLLDPEGSYWRAAKAYNEAYQLGVMDPDSFTMKFDNLVDKTKNNQLLFGWWGWAGAGDVNAAFREKGEVKGWEPLPPAPGQTQYRGEYGSIGNTNNMLAISKSSKHPERAMEVINYLLSFEGSRTIMNGVEGQTWKEENGKPVLIDFENRIKDPDFGSKTAVGKYFNWAGWTPGTIDPRFQVQLDYGLQSEYMKQGMSDLDKDYVAHYDNAEFPGQVITNKVEAGEIDWNGTDYGNFVGLPSVTPEDINRLDKKLEEYLLRMMPQLIMAKTQDEYNKHMNDMMDELKKMGAEKSAEYWENAYLENKKVIDSFK